MISVPADLINNNPGFANLWSLVQSKLTPNGSLPHIEEELRVAEEKLKEQRGKYLENLTLVRGLEEVVAQHRLQQQQHGEDDKSTRAAGRKTAQAQQEFQAASQALQVAQAMQRLRLPAAMKAPPPVGFTQDADPHLNGDLDSYLGVTASTLVQCHADRNNLSKAGQVALLAAVEDVLRAEARILGSAVGIGLDAKGTLSPEVVDAIQSKVEAVKEGRSSCLHHYQILLNSLQEYLQVVMQIQEILMALIQDCMLTKQRAMDEVACHHLIVQARTMYSKLRVIEQQFWLSTYTANNLVALNTIFSLLQQAFDATVSACNEIAAHLTAYRALGEDFEKIVKEYAGIQEELTRAYHTLDQFNELQRELEEAHMQDGM